MKLDAVRVQKWRNFVDSGWVPIDPNVTCLVGKNESGKSAFLDAIYRVNPAYSHDSFIDIHQDYPRWRKVRDERRCDLRQVTFVTARFRMNEEEVTRLSDALDVPLPMSTRLVVGRRYNGETWYSLDLDESELAQNLIREAGVNVAAQATSLEEAERAILSERKSAKGLRAKIQRSRNLLVGDVPPEAFQTIKDCIPKFFRFSQYSILLGTFRLNELLRKRSRPDGLKPDERTTLDLLQLAGMEGPELDVDNREARVANIEAAFNEITRQVMQYWTQNPYLKVRLDRERVIEQNAQRQPQYVDVELDVRIWDERHQSSTNFRTRSSGFQWFVSFLAGFSPFEGRQDIIVLLDEPALSLHGRAQKDFLRFVEERLAPSHQVFYTTHSPFLVDPARLERIRVIEDRSTLENPDAGAVVLTDATSKDADTVFPLQGALGYDLAQNLIIGSAEHLIVEGISDLIYLQALSDYLEGKGRVSLDPRFSIVPVGGLDKVPTFVALLGVHVPLTVLVDSGHRHMQRITDLIEEGILDRSRLVTIGQVLDNRSADIEDLFAPEEYLVLYNGAFGDNLTVGELDGAGPILKQIKRVRGDFNHRLPATYMLQHRSFFESVSPETLSRFERLFVLLNATLQ